MAAARADAASLAELDRILRQTVELIGRSQQEMFSIAEDARQELLEVQEELKRLKEQVADSIMQVDALEHQEREARRALLAVSRNLRQHSEAEIRTAYDQAREAQVKLTVAREREALLRRQRDTMARRLRRLERTVERADQLLSQVGMALTVLEGKLDELTSHVAGLQRRQQLGLSIIKAQEEERRRVARDIHDGPAQLLANVVFRLDVCQRLLASDQARALQELEQLKELVRGSLQDVRKIIFDLRPMALDDLGLLPALRSYLNGFEEKTGVHVNLTVRGEERRLPGGLEVAVFRLIQEALNNAWKHARASEVTVSLDLDRFELRCAVQDDGIGFDLDEVLAVSGERFGLISIRERVELLEGDLEIDTAPGQGTRVRFRLPVKE